MNLTPEIYVERLIELSRRKSLLLQEILLLSQSQTQFLNEDGIDALEKLLADKQAKIHQIDQLDEEFNVYFQGLKRKLNIKSLDELQSPDIKGIKELKQTVSQIMLTLKEITEIDNKNISRAKGLMGDIGNEIKKINQGKKMNNAYGVPPVFRPPAYYVDKKK